MMRTTITTSTSASDQWESNVIEKMRGIMNTSSRPLQDIFNEFDVDGNGVVTSLEFRNAIRKLNLGLSSKDID
jgi:Ca2+-binding EF-hand superfamily protein